MEAQASIPVLWEDSRGGPGERFGPHDLVLAMAADDVGLPRWELAARFGARPMKGVDRILPLLLPAGLEALSRKGQAVLAVLDGDRIRQHLRLAPDCEEACVLEALAVRSGRDRRLRVFLLNRNVESLVRAAIDCGVEASAQEERRALDHRPLERDILLARAAGAMRPVRDCIRNRVPSLEPIVAALAELSAS